MRRLTIPLALALIASASAALFAQDDSAPRQEPPAGQGQAPPQTPPAEQAPPQTPPVQRGAADDVFVPSEELSADEEVTFPVDI